MSPPVSAVAWSCCSRWSRSPTRRTSPSRFRSPSKTRKFTPEEVKVKGGPALPADGHQQGCEGPAEVESKDLPVREGRGRRGKTISIRVAGRLKPGTYVFPGRTTTSRHGARSSRSSPWGATFRHRPARKGLRGRRLLLGIGLRLPSPRSATPTAGATSRSARRWRWPPPSLMGLGGQPPQRAARPTSAPDVHQPLRRDLRGRRAAHVARLVDGPPRARAARRPPAARRRRALRLATSSGWWGSSPSPASSARGAEDGAVSSGGLTTQLQGPHRLGPRSGRAAPPPGLAARRDPLGWLVFPGAGRRLSVQRFFFRRPPRVLHHVFLAAGLFRRGASGRLQGIGLLPGGDPLWDTSWAASTITAGAGELSFWPD